MTTLHNEIAIDAPLEKIWKILTTVGELHNYDPTVRTSTVTSERPDGLGASRRVDMEDGKHWFEEEITACNKNEALTYQLTNCNFPIARLQHSYRFERIGHRTNVSQEMKYEVKYGLLGKLMDRLMLRGKSDRGIKRFFAGLKEYAEGT